MTIDETGGAHGVRDSFAILTLAELPKQKFAGHELYPDIYTKAALYAINIIKSHPFIDGNKRTGMVCAGIFLENNGHKIKVRKGSIEKFALKIVTNNLDLAEIATWLKKNSSLVARR